MKIGDKIVIENLRAQISDIKWPMATATFEDVRVAPIGIGIQYNQVTFNIRAYEDYARAYAELLESIEIVF